MIKIQDYIIAIDSVRGKCKKDVRYKVLKVYKKGQECFFMDVINLQLYWEEDNYLIKHNGRFIISPSKYFIYDYKYNRKLKIKNIKNLK